MGREAATPGGRRAAAMAGTAPAKTVLVVEDDDATRAGLAAALARHGYHAPAARDGLEAWGRLTGAAPPDLVLLDMMLPTLDGWRLMGWMRASRLPVPVVIISETALTPEWAAEHGARGFLHKPIEESALLAEVRRCLGPT